MRGHFRTADLVRVSHGLFRPRPRESDPDDEEEFLRELEAWRLVLPPGARFTHVTAARLRRWQLPALPDQVPVFASVGTTDRRPRRPGLLCARLVREGEAAYARGLPVDSAEETLLRAARDLGLLDLLILVDSARRLGDIDPGLMEDLLGSGRPGVRRLREAWHRSITTSDSAGETMLRAFDDCMDVEVRSQAPLRDEAGHLVGVADLRVCGTDLLHEYDGAHHRVALQQRIDLRRNRRLAQTAYDRRGYTLDDLLNHPAVVMHEIDRDLGRAHQLVRLRRWRRLVEASLYSPDGRRRMVNRWQRQMGVVEWAGTA